MKARRKLIDSPPPDSRQDGYVPVICGLSRANRRDIDAAWEAVRHAARPRVHTFIATSPIHMESKLKMTPDQARARSLILGSSLLIRAGARFCLHSIPTRIQCPALRSHNRGASGD